MSSQSLLLSGGVPLAVPVVFVSGGSFIVSAVGSAAVVANAVTGQRVKSLSNPGSGAVVALAATNNNEFLVFVATENKQVNLWDVSDGSLLKTWTFKDYIVQFTQDPLDHNAFFVVFASDHISTKKQSPVTFRLDHVSLKLLEDKKVDEAKRVISTLVANFKFALTGLAVSKTAVVVNTERLLLIWGRQQGVHGVGGVDSWGEAKRINLPKKQQIHNQRITALVAHPTTTLLSVGLSTGEILLYHNPFHTNPPVQILHWHAHPVTALTFMNDGTTLLSGGLESVLVMWQIDLLSKKTLPRIASGNALLSVSVSSDDAYIGLVCGDASVRAISVGNLSVKTCVMGLKSRQGRVLEGNGIVVDPRTGNLVVAGNVGCIQFYDAFRDTHIMEVEAVAQNRIVVVGGGDSSSTSVAANSSSSSSTSTTLVGENGLAAVKFVAFENEGRRSRWMATLDERDSMCVGGEAEVSLKFWLWDEVTQIYTVNTRVASPHDGPITSIRFFSLPDEQDPSKKILHLISTSLDTRFKVWELTPAPTTSRDQTPSWTQKSQGFYKDTPIYSAAISQDSSILAVACGSIVTLWDPTTNQMCGTLCHPHSREHVLRVEFVDDVDETSGQEVPVLVAVTASRVYVWNLLTGTCWWSLELGGVGIGLVVDSTDSKRFAVSVGVCAKESSTSSSSTTDHNDSPVEVDDSSSSKKAVKFVSTKILEFKASSPVPTMTYLGQGKVQGLGYVAKALVPTGVVALKTSTGSSSTGVFPAPTPRLLTLSSKFEIIAVGPESSKVSVVENSSPIVVAASTTGLLSGIYGQGAFDKTPTQLHTQTQAALSEQTLLQTTKGIASVEKQALSFIEGTASHLLAPPVKLAGAFFEAILKRRDYAGENGERARFGIRGLSKKDAEDVMEGVEGEEEKEELVSSDVAKTDDLQGLEFLNGVLKGLVIRNQKEEQVAAVAGSGVGDAKLVTLSMRIPAGASATPVAATKTVGSGSAKASTKKSGDSGVVIGSSPVKSVNGSSSAKKGKGKK
ncbi:UNVERIFIED_CONTAM: WD repeat-containing protein 75 [Siphonaria sp. JEL0065]|nr:WD repeat-containing protein 75 [Siphonaria sp. JEL0065]